MASMSPSSASPAMPPDAGSTSSPSTPSPIDRRFGAELLDLYDDQANAVTRLCSLNVVVGECFAQAALRSRSGQGSTSRPSRHRFARANGLAPTGADPALPLSTPLDAPDRRASVIAARTGAAGHGRFPGGRHGGWRPGRPPRAVLRLGRADRPGAQPGACRTSAASATSPGFPPGAGSTT